MPSLEIPYLPPNPNTTRGIHWARMQRIRKDAGYHVLSAWIKAGRPYHANRPATVQIHIEAHGKPDDHDNRLARMKVLVDELVRLEALRDDSPDWATLTIPTRSTGKKGSPLVRITITYTGALPEPVECSGFGLEGPPCIGCPNDLTCPINHRRDAACLAANGIPTHDWWDPKTRDWENCGGIPVEHYCVPITVPGNTEGSS